MSVEKKLPEIIVFGHKKEVSFKETEWYQNINIKDKAALSLAKGGMSMSSHAWIGNIEHYRIDGGYNVKIIRNKIGAESLYEREKEYIETDFVPFEYDTESYVASLDYSNNNLESINDLLSKYSAEEIAYLTELNINYIKIQSLDGILKFKALVKLTAVSNSIESWPIELFELANNYGYTFKYADLSNNKISTIPKTIQQNIFFQFKLSGNPIESSTGAIVPSSESEDLKFKVSVDNKGMLMMEVTDENPSVAQNVTTSKICKKCSAKIQLATFNKNNGVCMKGDRTGESGEIPIKKILMVAFWVILIIVIYLF